MSFGGFGGGKRPEPKTDPDRIVPIGSGDYECQHCPYQTDIDGEHKRLASAWCKRCKAIRTFKRVEESE